MRHSIRRKFGMLFPALSWLFIQFAMSGVTLGGPAGAMQIEICSPFGVQQIEVDPATGEPAEPVVGSGCDWCQSFGAIIDTAMRGDITWSSAARDIRCTPAPTPIALQRLAAGFHSRAPPVL